MKNRSAVSRLLCFFYWVLFCWEMLVSVVHGGLNIEMVRNLSFYEFYVLFQQKSISPKRSAKRVFDCSCRKWRFDLNTDKGNLLFYGRHLLHAKKAFPKTMFDAVLLKDMTAEKNWGIFWFLPFFQSTSIIVPLLFFYEFHRMDVRWRAGGKFWIENSSMEFKLPF